MKDGAFDLHKGATFVCVCVHGFSGISVMMSFTDGECLRVTKTVVFCPVSVTRGGGLLSGRKEDVEKLCVI
jgi:hypothetical protein